MKIILTTIFAGIFTLNTFATAQFGDILIMGGETNSIRSAPLENYFEVTKKDRPDFDDYFGASCSACWRGYIATWEVKGKSLYLVKVQDSEMKKEFQLNKIFSSSAPIKASWFSGQLSIPKGKCMNYVHMGFASSFEREKIIRINSGKVAAIYEINHKENWINLSKKVLGQYQPIKKSNPQNTELEEAKNDKLSSAQTLKIVKWAFEGAVYEYQQSEQHDKLPLWVHNMKFEINADISTFEVNTNHIGMSSYEFIQQVAKETGNTLNISVENGTITYEIMEANQQVEPIVTTPVDEVEAQSTQAHVERSAEKGATQT